MRLGKKAILCGLTILALAIRFWASRHLFVVSNDAAGAYLYQAQEILRGNWQDGLGTVFPPGYSILVSVLSKFQMDLVDAGKLVSVLCGGLLVPTTFLLVRRVYGEREAWIAAVLTVLSPTLIATSRDVATEALFTLLLMSTAIMGWEIMERGSPIYGAWAGILFGMSYLVRPEAIGFLGVFALIVLGMRALRRSGEGRGKWMRAQIVWLAPLLSTFLVVSIPYFVLLRVRTEGWQLTGKTMLNLLAHDTTDAGGRVDYEIARYSLAPDGRRLQIELDARKNTLSFIWEHRARLVVKFLMNSFNVYLKYLPQVISPVLWLLALVGVYRSGIEWTKAQSVLFLGSYFVFPVACYPIFWVEPRYFAPLVPIAIVWASRGLVVVSDDASKASCCEGKKGRFLGGVLAIVVLSTFWPVIDMIRERPVNYPMEQKEAGEWLRLRGRPHARVMSRKALVAFYSGGVPIELPYASLDQTLTYADSMNVDYLVVDQRYAIASRPGLAGLLDEKQPSRSLNVVYDSGGRPGQRLVIYDLQSQRP